jgi:MFS family permease
VVGGLLSLVSWRLIFFINLPVGVAAIVLVTLIAPSPRRFVPLDWIGQITAVLAMGSLTFGMIEAGANGFTASGVVVAFVMTGVALIAFIVTQARIAHPMVPLDLFRNRNIVIADVVGFAFMVGYYGLPFVMSLYLQQQRGLSPFATGAAFLPMMLIGAMLTPFSARIVERFGARLVVVSGLGCMAAGLAFISLEPATAPVPVFSALMILVGVAGPLVAPPITAVLLNSVPDSRAGTASGVYNTSRQIGGALAVAVFGALLAGQPTMAQGMRLSLLLAAGMALATAAVSLLMRSTTPRASPATVFD